MKNSEKNIGIKSQILRLLDKMGGVSNMTVDDMVSLFKRDVNSHNELIKASEQAVIDRFSNLYLKRFHVHRFFGEEMEVIELKGLELSDLTDEYERLYSLIGNAIIFNKINVQKKVLNEKSDSQYDSRTKKDLEGYEIITKEEFDSYDAKYELISGEISKIIKQ